MVGRHAAGPDERPPRAGGRSCSRRSSGAADWEILVDTADGDGKTGACTPAGGKLHRRGPRDGGAPPPGDWPAPAATDDADEHSLVGLGAVQRRACSLVLAVDLGVAAAAGDAGADRRRGRALGAALGEPVARLRRSCSGRVRGPRARRWSSSPPTSSSTRSRRQPLRLPPGVPATSGWGRRSSTCCSSGACWARSSCAAALILGGAALVHQFEWLLYLFGAFLLYTALRCSSAAERTSRRPTPRTTRC